MNNPSPPPVAPRRSPAFPLPFPRSSPAVPLTPNPWPLIPAVLLALLLLTACGRRPTEPTPLPPGTRVIQPTPDFSAPAQVGSTNQAASTNQAGSDTNNAAQAMRTRLAQQRTPQTPAVPPAVSPQLTRSSPDLSLEVFSRPNALGILAGGGILYTAPGGAARANLQVGATLTITGRSADSAWFAAYLADGTAGWVPAAQVRVFGDTTELETVQESLGPAVVATLIAQASQPQAPFTIATPTPAATDPAQSDPAQSDPAQSDPAQSDPAATPVPQITGPAVTVIVEGANLRAGPGTDYPVVSVLYQDDTAPLLGRNQTADWLQIDVPTGPAWIFAPLVQTSVPIPDLPQIDPPPNN